MKVFYCCPGRLWLYLALMYLLCWYRIPLHAQTVFSLKGKVIGQNEQVLTGANVQLKGKLNGATTDSKGDFELACSNGKANLIVSFIGYRSIDTLVVLPLTQPLVLTMTQDKTVLDEVKVSTGYWETSRRSSTGNISKVNADIIQKQPVSNPLAALAGRMPGVYIQQTTGVAGGGMNISIRGQNSLLNGNMPLYVIDGVPFTAQSISSFTDNDNIIASASPISMINPSDIESIEILKDADATSIYGSRGANGVVLITTKRGKEGKTRIDVNVSQGWAKTATQLDFLNTQQYLQMRNEAFANDGVQPRATDYDVNGTWSRERYTDWQKVLTGGTAHTTTAQMSLSGGSVNTQFILAGAYYGETTVFPGDNKYGRSSFNFNLNNRSTDQKFTAVFSALYSLENNNLFNADLTQYINLPPNAPELYDSNGDLNWENGTFNNPLAQIRKRFKTQTNNLVANTVMGYEITKGVKVRMTMGYTRMFKDEQQTNPLSAYSPYSSVTSQNISSNFATGSVKTWIVEPQLSWEKKLGNGQLTALAGMTMQESVDQKQRLRAVGFSSDALINQISAANSVTVVSAPYEQYRYNGFYARLNYQLKEKYLINVTTRRDGSSRFGPSNRYANFGAVGAGWIFSQEKFFTRLPFLSFGKIRASYGSTGNDQIGDYRYMELWIPTEYGYQGISGLEPVRIANNSYGWEINKKAEGGLDLGFFADQIQLSVAYFRNRSSNQLIYYTLAPSTGFDGVQSNLSAVVENRGWEFELNTKNIVTGSFSWKTALNLTIPKNKLLEFEGLDQSPYASSFEVGKPNSIQKLYHFAKVDPTTGLYMYEGFNEQSEKYLGLATDLNYPTDLQAIKKLDRNLFGGLNNSFSYKDLQLDVFFQFVSQTGRNYLTGFESPGTMGNQPTVVMDRWQKPGDNASIQRFSRGGEGALQYLYGARFYGDNSISDASFIRLKNAQLSYRYSPKFQNKDVSFRLYIQGQNLWTWTKFLGTDPESQNILNIPPLRAITAGVQITL